MAQIATIKLETASGPVELPVFETADAGSDVYDMVRVQTPSGVGFIPFVDTGSASFPYLRLQTETQGVLGAHDSASLGTFGRYYVQEENGNTHRVASDGTSDWSTDTGNFARGITVGADKNVYVADSGSDEFHRINGETGIIEWSTPFNFPQDVLYATDRTELILPGGNTDVADPSDGSVLRSTSADIGVGADSVYSGSGFAYGGFQNGLYAKGDFINMNAEWSVDTADGGQDIVGTTIDANNVYFAVADLSNNTSEPDAQIIVRDKTDGSFVDSHTVHADGTGIEARSISYYNGKIYFLSDGDVKRFDASTFNEDWSTSIPSGINFGSSMAINPEVSELYVPDGNGDVKILDFSGNVLQTDTFSEADKLSAPNDDPGTFNDAYGFGLE